jgi:cyclopropane fatty-acyl-phospholipid synthase-like methyltransferase
VKLLFEVHGMVRLVNLGSFDSSWVGLSGQQDTTSIEKKVISDLHAEIEMHAQAKEEEPEPFKDRLVSIDIMEYMKEESAKDVFKRWVIKENEAMGLYNAIFGGDSDYDSEDDGVGDHMDTGLWDSMSNSSG